jgi:ABC-2 type transport system permease protein
VNVRDVNLQGGWALIKSTWYSWMQYRSFFFLLAFGWMIPPLIYLFVWSTAAGQGSIGGLDRGAFIAYYLVLILVNQLTYAQSNWTVGDVIRSGGLNPWLLRPIAPLFQALFTEVAGKVVYMTFVTPVVAILALVLQPHIHLTAANALAFIPALILAWALRFFWGYWLALLAFWATRADALLALQDGLVFLLGGQVAPTPLLSGILHLAATVLPFRYMVSFPVEILTGQLAASGLLNGFAWQMGWLVVALSLSALAWHQGLRRYTAIGG